MSDEASRLRAAMVDALVAGEVVRTPAVERAFRATPRHLFVPDVPLETAYADEAIPTKLSPQGQAISSSSQPAIMAIMLEQLELAPGMRVLEVGAGTGYNAALLARLVGPSGRVTTLDLESDIVESARGHLAAAGVEGARVVQADGALGWPEGAPYDRVVLTVGAWDVLPAWSEQLAPGGRLLLPLALRVATVSACLEPAGDHLASRSLYSCGFMSLRGVAAGPPGALRIEAAQWLAVDDARRLDRAEVALLLSAPVGERATGLRLSARAAGDDLGLWCALHDPSFAILHVRDGWRERGLPFRPRGGAPASTFGLVDADGAGLFVRPADDPAPAQPAEAPSVFALHVRAFGAGGAAERLTRLAAAWDAAGRPTLRQLRLRVYRSDAAPALSGAVVLGKTHTRVVAEFAQQIV